MLKHFARSIPFREHSVFGRVANAFEKIDSNATSLKLLKNHTKFIYPKTICFSFHGYTITIYRSGLDGEPSIDEEIMLREGQSLSEPTIPRSRYLSFFHALLQSFEQSKFYPLVVIDLMGRRIFDQSALNNIIDIVLKFDYRRRLVIFAALNGSELLIKNLSDRQISMVFPKEEPYEKELYNYIDRFSRKPENILHVPFEGSVNLSSLETSLEGADLGNKIVDKSLVSFNIEKVNRISIFSLNLLNVIIHSLAHQHGSASEIVHKEARRKVVSRLETFRTFDVNRFFFPFEDTEQKTQERDLRNFGAFLFDEDTHVEMLDKFETFATNLSRMFPDYLQGEVSTKYDFPGTYRKPVVFRMPRHRVIVWVVSELTENVILHAEGTGYLSAHVSKYMLYLFVGDCGIGLKRGILKNYELDSVVTDHESALGHLFKLHELDSKRRSQYKSRAGAGRGLRGTLNNIFLCRGRFIFRTGNKIAGFLNPVTRGYGPSTIRNSSLDVSGCQYMIIIPLQEGSISSLPNTFDDFLILED